MRGVGGQEQRSWGNRSSKLIRGGVLLKMSLHSPGDQVQQSIASIEKERVCVKCSASGQQAIFNVWDNLK